jgi:RHS repeat-associated protein
LTISTPTSLPQVIEETVNGAVVRQYPYGRQRISENQVVDNSWTVSIYGYDGGGSVRQLTNAAGAVTDAYEYDAFGNLISSDGTTPNVYLYRGERYDTDLGLYYLRARWYNPVTGRFMTRDPYEGSIYDPASLHRYNYSRANPANFIDPSGRAATSDYIFLGLNALAEATAVTAAGEAISCSYFALASAVDLVGQHVGQDIDQLGLLWQGCMAKITVKQHLVGIGTNLLGIGVGRAISKGIGWLLEDAELGLQPCALCFAAGTPVQTDHGSVSIESIKVGDKVWARDTKTGKNELRAVTAVAPQHRDKLVELRIAGENHVLRATPVHPFWARRTSGEAAHWINAGNLLAGEQLETEDGRWVEVQAVAPLQGLTVAYNFTVEQDHDYFVGDEGLLVHNAGGPFSIWDWSGYPEGVPQPSGPFNLLDGPDYQAARQAANNANQALHEAAPELQGFEIQEIQPVKFGGSPTDLANKMVLEPGQHHEVTNWWRKIQACGK